jgi:CheY-like chemotaxis protein
VAARGKVLVVDDDRDIADLVREVLSGEGYAVSVLTAADPDRVRAAVAALEPDCVLLDGESGAAGYGASWAEATALRAGARPVPVVMFTAHAAAVREAEAGESARSRAAGFAAVLPKPFPLDDLLAAVARCIPSSGAGGPGGRP